MSFIQSKQASIPTMVQEKQASTTLIGEKQASLPTMIKQLKSREPESYWDETGIFWDNGVTYWDIIAMRKQKQSSTTFIKEKQA